MFTAFLTTYGAVFVAEIVGDKLLYTTGVLATRYRSLPIVIGMVLAFMLKMGAAVLIGESIRLLPPWIVATVSGLSFAGVALALWFKPDKRPESKPEDVTMAKATLVTFGVIFFSEWADVGQITAATMATRFALPWAVWAGAVLAMVTKGALGAFLGLGVRQWIRDRIAPKVVRYVGVASMIALGIWSVWEILDPEK